VFTDFANTTNRPEHETMSHVKADFHCIFSTKNRQRFIDDTLRESLFPYMGGIARNNKIHPICIGGVEDHVHLLISLPATLPICKAMQYVKGGSSKWIHDTLASHQEFAWQKMYAAFSVSHSQRPSVIRYIENQREHHRKKSFKEELIEFLKAHEIEYDERYLWL
jgi:REP element-mobilizing transposase RayT